MPAQVATPPERRLRERAAGRLGGGLLVGQRLGVHHVLRPRRRPGRLSRLRRHAARGKVVAVEMHAVLLGIERRIRMEEHPGRREGVQDAVDPLLLEAEHVRHAGTARGADQPPQVRVIIRREQFDGTVADDPARQAVAEGGPVIGEDLLRAERDRIVVVVEHLLAAAVFETPEPQRHFLEPAAAVGLGVFGADHPPPQERAHRRGVVEVHRSHRLGPADAEEREEPAPVVRFLVPGEFLVAEGIDGDRVVGQVGIEPSRPVGLHVVLHGGRQGIAIEMPCEQVVLHAPAQPIPRRPREHRPDEPGIGFRVAGLDRLHRFHAAPECLELLHPLPLPVGHPGRLPGRKPPREILDRRLIRHHGRGLAAGLVARELFGQQLEIACRGQPRRLGRAVCELHVEPRGLE